MSKFSREDVDELLERYFESCEEFREAITKAHLSISGLIYEIQGSEMEAIIDLDLLHRELNSLPGIPPEIDEAQRERLTAYAHRTVTNMGGYDE